MPDQEVEYHKDLVAIKDWLSKQPHLPHDVDDVLLRRFFASCDYSLERAKRTIDFFFTLRSTAPELFCKRDPWSPEIRRVFEITDMLPLPNKTKENYKVFIYRLKTPELDLFNFIDAVKTFFMLADTRLTEEDDIPSGEIPIFDSANVSLKFMGKVNISVLRKYMLYTQEAIPIRLKQVHIINAPSYIGKIYGLCKPFIKSEVAKLVKFHEPNSTSLYKDVPQELLPDEYGGKAGTVDQIKRYWIKRIEAKSGKDLGYQIWSRKRLWEKPQKPYVFRQMPLYRPVMESIIKDRDIWSCDRKSTCQADWFLANDKNWAVDEALRPSNCKDDRAHQVRDLSGSFRSLTLD